MKIYMNYNKNNGFNICLQSVACKTEMFKVFSSFFFLFINNICNISMFWLLSLIEKKKKNVFYNFVYIFSLFTFVLDLKVGNYFNNMYKILVTNSVATFYNQNLLKRAKTQRWQINIYNQNVLFLARLIKFE